MILGRMTLRCINTWQNDIEMYDAHMNDIKMHDTWQNAFHLKYTEQNDVKQIVSEE